MTRGLSVRLCDRKDSGQEVLRAILVAEHRSGVGKLAKRFERAGGRSARSRLIHVACKYGANVYSSDEGTLEELRFFVERGRHVIVGMRSRVASTSVDEEAGPGRAAKCMTQFALVIGIDDKHVTVICPAKGECRSLAGDKLLLDEFLEKWSCIDDERDSRTGNGKSLITWYAVLNFDNEEYRRAFGKGVDTTQPDTRRRGFIISLTVGLGIVALYATYHSYRDPTDYTWPLVAIFVTVGGAAAIDFFARPEKREYSETLVPRWYRGYLAMWCLVPFLIAVGGSVWVHFQKWNEARADIRQLAYEIKAVVEWPDGKDTKAANPKLDSQAGSVSPPTGVGSGSAPAPLVGAGSGSAPATPSVLPADGSDDPITAIVKHRGRFSVDEATNLCWMAAQGISQREAEFLTSRESRLKDKPNPFARIPFWAWTQEFENTGSPHALALTLGISERTVEGTRRHAARRVANGRYWRCFTTERIHERVETLVAARYREDKDSAEAKRFASIARVVGHDLLISHGDIDVVCDEVGSDTATNFALSMGIQGLFVLWVPALLAIAISRSQKRSKRASRRAVQRTIDFRDHVIMAEDQYLFVPRMCFAILLVLGTNYVFAPLGLKATYVMSLVDEHALPGHTTFTLWSTSFSEAPVLVVGFVGFLLYALITATQRFVLDDFDDRALLGLFVRGLVVILLSFALSSGAINDFASRTFVFIAGVFPVRALEAIGKRFNMTIDPDFTSADQGTSFAGLPGLDPVKVFALRTVGIQSTYDLATMNIRDVAEKVRIDPRLLGRAVDRAILIDALGITLTEKLSAYGITSATELVDTVNLMSLLPDSGASLEAVALLAAAQAVQRRLITDDRVDSVRGWLATRSDN